MNASLPGLPEAVVEEVASLPDRLEGATPCGLFSAARPGALLRVMPGLASFLASDGRLLRYTMAEGKGPSAALPLLQGPMSAALIYQRGEFPLHAATLAAPHGGGVIALTGNRGAGKSTLAYALLERGWMLLNDDLSRLTEGPDGGVSVVPGRRGIRLTPESCALLGLRASGLARATGEREKYLVDAPPAAAPQRLTAVILLDRTGDDGLIPLIGAEAARTVAANSYRPAYVGPLGVAAIHFAWVARIATRCRIVRLRRDAAPGALAEALSTLSGPGPLSERS